MPRFKTPPDWQHVRAEIAAGMAPARAAARAGVSLRRLQAQFRAAGWPLATKSGASGLARTMLAAAHTALGEGDVGAVERLARAVERLLKAETLLAARAGADAKETEEMRAERLRTAEDRLFDLVEEELARRRGERAEALPLWRRFNRPDRAPEGEPTEP